MKFIAKMVLIILKLYQRALMYIVRSNFKKHGTNFIFDPFGLYTFDTISIGNDVFISKGAVFMSSNSSITIGNKVLIGPNVTIVGGDHNTTMIGSYMFDVTNKLTENDLPIMIHDDVWVGAGAIILKGVTIGRGSIIASGSVVSRDVRPYTVVGGVPAKFLKMRFDSDSILKHELLLYPHDKRLSKSYIDSLIHLDAGSNVNS